MYGEKPDRRSTLDGLRCVGNNARPANPDARALNIYYLIQESTIERVLARLESGSDDYAQEVQDFAAGQPALVTYLTNNEDYEALNDEERTLLLFGALVIYHAITDERTEPAPATEEAIGQAEEKNYTLLPERGPFRERLTPLFDSSAEEELLAFAEDLIVAEADEDGITKEAREPMFVALKTMVDVLT